MPVQTMLLASNTLYMRRGWKLHRPALPLAYRARRGRCFAMTDIAEATAEVERYFAAELAQA